MTEDKNEGLVWGLNWDRGLGRGRKLGIIAAPLGRRYVFRKAVKQYRVRKRLINTDECRVGVGVIPSCLGLCTSMRVY